MGLQVWDLVVQTFGFRFKLQGLGSICFQALEFRA